MITFQFQIHGGCLDHWFPFGPFLAFHLYLGSAFRAVLSYQLINAAAIAINPGDFSFQDVASWVRLSSGWGSSPPVKYSLCFIHGFRVWHNVPSPWWRCKGMASAVVGRISVVVTLSTIRWAIPPVMSPL